MINYVQRCDTCQKQAKNKEIPEAASATIRAEPFSHIRIDVIGPLPVTLTGKRYIILAVDFFTKYTEAIAVRGRCIDSSKIHIFRHHLQTWSIKRNHQ